MPENNLLFRALPPTGARSVTWTEWERKMAERGPHQDTLASITSRMLSVYDQLPTKSEKNIASAVYDLQHAPVFTELRELFRRLPIELRPMATDTTSLILISFRFAAAMTLAPRGPSH